MAGPQRLRRLPAALLCVGLAACGGGGGGAPNTTAQAVAQQCSAQNPYAMDATSATTVGSLNTEKEWVRRYMNEAYLWPEHMPTVNAALANYSNDTRTGFWDSIEGYFEALKSKQITASGYWVDQFSFIYSTHEWHERMQSGASYDYGINWIRFTSSPPRRWVVAGVQPGSPAALAGVQRGDSLTSVSGVDFANGADVPALNAGLFPSTPNARSFAFAPVSGGTRNVSMAPGDVITDPVPLTKTITTPNGKVGYIAFDSHIETAEEKLHGAAAWLKAEGIADLVIDLRYNSGGYLYIASELAYAVAGNARTQGKVFEKLVYNASRTADNAKAPIPFYGITSTNQPIAELNLSRVYLLTSGDTCSASESLINSLRGVNVEVYLIGNTTCGKPYGFTAKDNCGISYFPIEFKGVNHKGFGEYSDGFVPATSALGGNRVPGCPGVPDDLGRAIGDPAEGMLKAALDFRASGNSVCPVPVVSAARPAVRSGASQGAAAAGAIAVPVIERLQRNKWLGRP